MEHLPPVILLALGGALLVAAVEIFAWYTLSPACMPLMLLKLDPRRPLPRVSDINRLRGLQGTGQVAVWRFRPEQRALFFRRRRTFGRCKANLWGYIRFGRDGQGELRWAPFPLLLYPAMPFFAWPMFYLDRGELPQPAPFVVSLVIATLLVLVINLLMARSVLENSVLDEVQAQIEARLG